MIIQFYTRHTDPRYIKCYGPADLKILLLMSVQLKYCLLHFVLEVRIYCQLQNVINYVLKILLNVKYYLLLFQLCAP